MKLYEIMYLLESRNDNSDATPDAHSGISDEDSGDEDVVNMNHLQWLILWTEVLSIDFEHDEADEIEAAVARVFKRSHP